VKRIALVLLILIGLAMFASAAESDFYVKTLYIEKVYPHELGYKIEYRRANSIYLADAYLPIGWFGRPDSPGRLIYADDKAVPFINVYWKDGEFHHFVLVVNSNYQDLSWGSLERTEAVAARFDVDEPEFVF
jgi:hypothetical protein